VLELIEERYREPLTVSGLAHELAVSPDHLSRLVKRATGASVSQWLSERRMAEARRLLVVTDEHIAVVAAEVGYRDAGYFRRVFRRLHGVSPREWRARTREPI
jgi:AraC-like DNA-binding protein